MSLLKRVNSTQASPAVILIRVMVGGIFLYEGIQKLLFPELHGAGRFAKIGIPHAETLGPFVGCIEIAFGALLLLGFLTRLATIPLLINILVAIVSTKIPILLGHGFWHFTLPKVTQYGVWGMLHEGRADFSMLLGLLFLLIVGAGGLSLDARIGKAGGEKSNATAKP